MMPNRSAAGRNDIGSSRTAVQVAHAQENLHVSLALGTGLNRHHPLPEQLEAAVLHRVIEPRRPIELLTAQARVLLALLVDLHAVAAAVLRQVAGAVGARQGRVRVHRAVAERGHAGARADLEEPPVPREAVVGNRRRQLLHHAHRLSGRDVEQHQAELVSAQARHHVALSQPAAHPRGEQAQQLVACGMPAGVVDDLELIQIDDGNAVGAAVRARLLDRAIDLAAKRAPVEDAGEGVVRGVVGELLHQARALGDVAEDEHGNPRVSRIVAEERARELDLDPLARRGREVRAARHEIAGRQRRGLMVDVEPGGLGIAPLRRQHLANQPAHRRARRPARHRLGERVHVHHASPLVDGDDAVAHPLERHLRHPPLQPRALAEVVHLAADEREGAEHEGEPGDVERALR
jgi:hypothetical protein